MEEQPITQKIATKEEVAELGLKGLMSGIDEPTKYIVMDNFFKEDANIELKSDLTEGQIKGLTILDVAKAILVKRYGYNGVILPLIRRDVVILNIPKNRKSRLEAFETLKAEADRELKEARKNMIDNFMRVR